MFKILVVEDDKNTARLIQSILKHAGYETFHADNGADALKVMETQYVDLIVADLMMPEMDGYQLTTELRQSNNTIPILIVTAKQLPDEIKKGFNAGCDDYMVKPINEDEMLLRIKALLRRSGIINERRLTIGDVTLNYDELTVTGHGECFTLPQKEFYLLYKLLSYPNKIFTRIQLMDEIWGMECETSDTTINVHINRLKKRFSDWDEFEIIAIRGIGYKAVIKNEE